MLIKPEAELFLSIKCQLPLSLLPWVTYQYSLTDRLQERAGNTCLQVLAQRWVAPDWWDKYVLRIEDETVLHREILMWAGQEACWYARTIIPKATYQANTLLFSRLQTESLGTLIFNEPQIKRVYLMHYSISQQSIEYHWLNQLLHGSSKTLWVRLSAFTVNDDSPFFLIETLLPALERYSK